MNKSTENIEEIKFIAAFSIFLIIILKVLFYKETISVILRFFLSFMVIGIIPGYILSNLFFKSLDKVPKFLLGVSLSLCLAGAFSYYTGLMGLHLKYFIYVYYLILILAYLFERRFLTTPTNK